MTRPNRRSLFKGLAAAVAGATVLGAAGQEAHPTLPDGGLRDEARAQRRSKLVRPARGTVKRDA